MSACPGCHSEDMRVGWPESDIVPPSAQKPGGANPLLVPLTCKVCGYEWEEEHPASYLPPPTEGERRDKEEARA